jgi:hypothetical protein
VLDNARMLLTASKGMHELPDLRDGFVDALVADAHARRFELMMFNADGADSTARLAASAAEHYGRIGAALDGSGTDEVPWSTHTGYGWPLFAYLKQSYYEALGRFYQAHTAAKTGAAGNGYGQAVYVLSYADQLIDRQMMGDAAPLDAFCSAFVELGMAIEEARERTTDDNDKIYFQRVGAPTDPFPDQLPSFPTKAIGDAKVAEGLRVARKPAQGHGSAKTTVQMERLFGEMLKQQRAADVGEPCSMPDEHREAIVRRFHADVQRRQQQQQRQRHMSPTPQPQRPSRARYFAPTRGHGAVVAVQQVARAPAQGRGRWRPRPSVR